MDLNPTHLAAFRAVAEAGSFTRGAMTLGVSQPAVSKQVAELERVVGFVLIDRDPRKAVLTEAGETLLPYARRLADTLADAKTALNDLSALRQGRLRVGATPTLATYLLPRTLVYFRQRFPAIEVSISVRSAAGLFDEVTDGRIDVALTGRPPEDPAVASRVFMTDPLVPVCATGHALTGRRSVRAAALVAHRLILRDGPKRTPGYVERVLRARGIAVGDALRLPHTESVKQAALAGLGVAFLPGIAAADDVAAGRLHRLSVSGLRLSRPYHVAERLRPSRAMRAYACVLKHAVRGSLPAARAARA